MIRPGSKGQPLSRSVRFSADPVFGGLPKGPGKTSMNPFAVIILAALLADFLLHAGTDYLNLKVLRNEIPKEFEGVYDPEGYRRSQEYLKVNTRFGWTAGLFNLGLLLLFFWSCYALIATTAERQQVRGMIQLIKSKITVIGGESKPV